MHHQRFLIKFFVFLACNVLAWFAWLWIARFPHGLVISTPVDGNTQSRLLTMPQNKTYDFLLLGTSHAARLDSNSGQNVILETTNLTHLNLAKDGSGILPERIYLSSFWNNHNSANFIVYFIDPFVFFSPRWNEQYSFSQEPYHTDVLLALQENHFNQEIISDYIRANFDPRLNPESQENKSCATTTLLSIDTSTIMHGPNSFYARGFESSVFSYYASFLTDTITMVKKRHVPLLFVVPPNLWKNEDPGKQKLLELLSLYQKKYQIDFYDFSNAIPDPRWYEDTNHLNCAGIFYFTKNFLKPLLNGEAEKSRAQ